MAQARWRYWLAVKDSEAIYPTQGEEGFTREQAVEARLSLVKQGVDNKRIVTVITVEDEG